MKRSMLASCFGTETGHDLLDRAVVGVLDLDLLDALDQRHRAEHAGTGEFLGLHGDLGQLQLERLIDKADAVQEHVEQAQGAGSAIWLPFGSPRP
jgi:hypothetical protein